jgi:hypothetical protein
MCSTVVMQSPNHRNCWPRVLSTDNVSDTLHYRFGTPQIWPVDLKYVVTFQARSGYLTDHPGVCIFASNKVHLVAGMLGVCML